MNGQTSPDSKNSQPEKPPEVQKAATPADAKAVPAVEKTEAKKWHINDEKVWESFPASDAPAGWAGRDISPAEREARTRADKARSERQSQENQAPEAAPGGSQDGRDKP